MTRNRDYYYDVNGRYVEPYYEEQRLTAQELIHRAREHAREVYASKEKQAYQAWEKAPQQSVSLAYDPYQPLKPICDINIDQLLVSYPSLKDNFFQPLKKAGVMEQAFFQALVNRLRDTHGMSTAVYKYYKTAGTTDRYHIEGLINWFFTNPEWLRETASEFYRRLSGKELFPSQATSSKTSTSSNNVSTKKDKDTKMAVSSRDGKSSDNKNKTLDSVKEAMVHGAKVAVADEAGEVMLGVAEVMLGDAYPALLATPDGKEVAKGMTAIALMYAIDVLPGVVPQEDGVRAASSMVLEAVSRDLVQPRLKRLEPVLMSLATAGAKVLAPTTAPAKSSKSSEK